MGNGFFRHRWLPLWLALPQLIVMFLFFYLPIYLAFFWAFRLERPFGGGSEFVGWANFERILSDPETWFSIRITIVYTIVATVLSILAALVLALAADRAIRLSPLARNMLIWPKAVAVAASGVVFLFIFNPYLGILAFLNDWYPGIWDPRQT